MNEAQLAVPVDRAALTAHYRQVESFQNERAKTSRRISRVLMVVAGVAILGNLAQALTIAAMMPLTRIEPVYLWVRGDGTVDSSITMSRLPATQVAAVFNAALWEYVRLREGFSYDTAQYNYDVVCEMSAPAVRSAYQTYFNFPNPLSPLVKFGKTGTVEIQHISSANLSSNLQQIRFRRIETMQGQVPVTTTWTATLQFATVTSMPVQLRLRNPGGVVIASYQAAQDTVR